MSEDAIRIRSLEKSFPQFKLGPLDLTVPKGAIYGLIGPNGAGKTTMMDLIMGMGAKDAGSIEVLGMDHIREEVAVKKQVGYCSPDLIFNAWGRVGRLINFVRAFYETWDNEYCMSLMARLNITPRDPIATLSFGARIKLGLVVALSHRPKVLILDEPLSGLDALAKQEVFSELLAAVQDEERTVLISSHNLHDLERFTDHIGVLHRGQLLLEGPTAVLVDSYRTIVGTSAHAVRPEQIPNVHVQHRDGDHWRLLVDISGDTLKQLEEIGMNEMRTTPVTLEELFVGLIKGNQP